MADRTHRTKYELAAEDRASPTFKKVEGAMNGVHAAGLGLAKVFATIGVGFSAGAFVTSITREVKEAEQASNRLRAALRATGHDTSFSVGELDKLAEGYQNLFGFTDESVRNAQANLLKFGNVTGDVFRDGLRLSADLAAQMGTDIPEAAQMIGKSLQSPTEGLTMMERQYGKLHDAEEKHIEQLVKSGKAIEAQRAVLDLWERKIGGTAALMNTGLTKATRDVANAWSDMLEALGKTETVGGIADRILKSIAGTLKDIENVAKSGAGLAPLERQLALIEGEIARIERGRPARGRSPLIDEQLAKLKGEREALQQTLAAARSTAVDPFAFDPKTIDVKLGGKDPNQEDKAALAKAQREAEFLSEKAVELQELAAADTREAWEAYTKVRLANEQRILDQQREAAAAHVRSAEIAVELAEDMVYTWDAAGNRIEITREQFDLMQEQQKKNKDFAKELGLTFTSAFEDAALAGEKLREVLRGIGQDIARIILRRKITEPFANAIGGINFGGLFGDGSAAGLSGGTFASGGRPPVGRVSLVGERGPELFIPDSAGTIVPNGRFGGVTIHQGPVTVTGPGVTMAEVRQALAVQHRQTVTVVREIAKRGA